MKKIYIIIFAICIMGFVTKAEDGLDNETSGKDKLKNQTLNFEDELVEGGLQKPELFYLLQKKNFNYKKLIKLRDNFLPELRESGELVRKTGEFN